MRGLKRCALRDDLLLVLLLTPDPSPLKTGARGDKIDPSRRVLRACLGRHRAARTRTVDRDNRYALSP
jgi:hypothetical protein